MIVDVMGWSFIICVIAFITLILCSIVISCVTDLTENKPANVFLGSLGIILVVSFIVSVTTFILVRMIFQKIILNQLKQEISEPSC